MSLTKACLPVGREFIKVIIIVAIAVPIINLVAATVWVGPTNTPPNGNAEAPVNVSANSQEKLGDLTIHRTEGGYDVGSFTTDILQGLGGALFNKNQLLDDKKVIIQTDGNVGIGTVSPQGPAPNNKPANLDVNDVYLRSTDQWVSKMSGGGGGGLPVGYEYVIFQIPPEARIFKIGTTAKAVCKIFSDKDLYLRGEIKHDDGILKTRAYMTGNYIANPPEAGNCDSGWINGLNASCSSTKPGRYAIAVDAKASTLGINVSARWCRGLFCWSCTDDAVWR